MENPKKHDLGTKLLNELMVDIIGALIPGFLFIIVVFISVVLPLIIYYDGDNKFMEAIFGNGGFWWVLLIICVFFSYVVGHIFYRADISVPDKKDVKRQVTRFLKSVKKSLIVSDRAENQSIDLYKSLLRQEIAILNKRLVDLLPESKSATKDKDSHLDSLKKVCGDALEELKSDNEHVDIKKFWPVLFPEDIINNGEFALSPNSENVVKKYKEYFACLEHTCSDGLLNLVICYCILHNQMDIGCATSDRGDFPYTNYYKYLLKRNMLKLLEHVDWYRMEERSKNKINSLKVKIQIFANEAYPLINKNESHIRMSSSTWHMSSLLFIVTIASSICFAAILFCNMFTDSSDNLKFIHYMAALLPLTMLLLVSYIRYNITHYIHYQRMREIQYTLQIYDQFKDIIDYRRNLYSGKIVPERESDSTRKDCEVKVNAKIVQL
ncbi:MAG: hypothetical protein IKY27_08785 [Bacteroidales bacterium]|nr:hypothetical protein [Bacteroidales bacterium]